MRQLMELDFFIWNYMFRMMAMT